MGRAELEADLARPKGLDALRADMTARSQVERDDAETAKLEASRTLPGATGFEVLPAETAARDPMREIKQRFLVPDVPGLRQVAEFVIPGSVPEVATMGIMGLPGRGLLPVAKKVAASMASGLHLGGAGLSERGESLKTTTMALLGAGSEHLWDPAFRLGSYAYKRYGKELADKVVNGAKSLTSWWEDIPVGHEGVQALLRDGIALLQKGYGAAHKAAFGESLAGQKIPLAVEDAASLGLAPASKAFPEGTVLVEADQALEQAALRGHSEYGAVIENRVRAAVGQLVDALRPSRPEAAAKIAEGLAGKAPATARAQYREGMNFLDALLKTNPMREGVLDARAFISGLDKVFSVGGVPSTIWRRFLSPRRAPEARTVMEAVVPKGVRPPEEVGVPFVSAWLGHGGPRVGERLPLAVGYKHLPPEAPWPGEGFVAPAIAGLTGRTFGELAESVSP